MRRLSSARKPTTGPIIGCHDIDCGTSQDSRHTTEPQPRYATEKSTQKAQNLAVLMPPAKSSMSTRHSSSARSVGLSVSHKSAAATSAYYMPSEYSFSDVLSCNAPKKPSLEVAEISEDEDECVLTKALRKQRLDKEHEAHLEEIKKGLKIGKYRETVSVEPFSLKVQDLPRGESLESIETTQLFAEETQEKPYEDLPPKYINSPIKKAITSILTRPKR
jgi:hypothetical protein